MSGILQAQTGGAFTVYDGGNSSCNSSQANFCYPVIIGAIPDRTGRQTPPFRTPLTITRGCKAHSAL